MMMVTRVLTTDPVNVRFHWVVNSIHLERPLRDARLRMTFTADGGLEGILAGYTPIEEMYDFQYGFRNGARSLHKPRLGCRRMACRKREQSASSVPERCASARGIRPGSRRISTAASRRRQVPALHSPT